MEQNQSNDVTTLERSEKCNKNNTLSRIQRSEARVADCTPQFSRLQSDITLAFDDIGLLTEYRYSTSPCKENDRGNNGCNIEIIKVEILIDEMNTNTEIMQSGKSNDCEKNQFSKRFPFVCHEINTSFTNSEWVNGMHFHYVLGVSRNQRYFW